MCNVVFALLMENRSAEDREQLESDLYAPPGLDKEALLRMGLEVG